MIRILLTSISNDTKIKTCLLSCFVQISDDTIEHHSKHDVSNVKQEHSPVLKEHSFVRCSYAV